LPSHATPWLAVASVVYPFGLGRNSFARAAAGSSVMTNRTSFGPRFAGFFAVFCVGFVVVGIVVL